LKLLARLGRCHSLHHRRHLPCSLQAEVRRFSAADAARLPDYYAMLERLADTRMSLGGLRNPEIDRLRAQVLAENPVLSPGPRRSRVN